MSKILLKLSGLFLQVSIIICSTQQCVLSQWSQLSTPYVSYSRNCMTFSDNVLYYGSQNGMYTSTNNGSGWTYITNGIYFQQISEMIRVGSYVYAGSTNGLYVSSDHGNNWSTTRNGYVEYLSTSENILYSWGAYGLTRTSDSGSNWSNITNPTNSVYAIGSSNSHIFISGKVNAIYNGIYSTSDNGLSWRDTIISPPVYCFTAGTNSVFGGSVNGTYLSTDNGVQWKYLNTLRGKRINCLSFNNSILYAGTDSGVYLSTNNGNSWINRSQGFVKNVLSLAFSDYYVFAESIIDGIYRRSIADIVDVHNISSQVPENFSLSQNYPNPYNPSTKINFSLPLKTYVKLKVYNSIGKEVASLVNENLNAGTYQYEFNAENLSSGIYYYTLETESFSETKRMVLIK